MLLMAAVLAIPSMFAALPSVQLKDVNGNAVNTDWQDETGVKLIAVSIDEAQNAQKVKPLVDGMGWEYDVLLDPNGEFKRQMGVTDVPHAFIVDGEGNVVWSHKGYVDGGEEEIIEVLRGLQK